MPDDRIDLADTALILAALDRPRVSLERYRLHLRDLADGVARQAAKHENDTNTLDSRAAALLAVMASEYGYRGDQLTYDDLQNANLMRVIDRRKGLPVALGILYIHAARAQGWPAYGINFPAHFLIALDHGGSRLVLDPFAGRRLADANELRALRKTVAGKSAELSPQHSMPLSNRSVLLRLQNNIKARLAGQGRNDQAAAVIDRMLLFSPGEIEMWREAGTLHSLAGNLRAAQAAFEHYVTLTTDAAARQDTIELLKALRQRLN